MHASDLPASPDLSIPQIPVICDKCRAEGFAGDDAFSAIPDILNFTPVQRRAHVNGWTDQHQRSFIAALAITGSPRQAARAIGKHQFGAEQLRNHRTGKSFAAAWDAAIELARERETHRIHENLAELSKQRDVELDAISPSPRRGEGWGEGVRGPSQTDHFPPGYDPDFDDEERLEYLTAQEQIRERMLRARRLLLYLYASDEDPTRRDAWESLCGPVNWRQAAANEAEDGEAYAMRHAKDADMMVCAEVGFLPELTGGEDRMTQLVMEALRLKASGEVEEE